MAKQDTPKNSEAAFQNKLRLRMREGWQLVGRSDDPPRARLRRRADGQRGRRGRDTLLFENLFREIWIDADGIVHDELAPEETSEAPEAEPEPEPEPVPAKKPKAKAEPAAKPKAKPKQDAKPEE